MHEKLFEKNVENQPIFALKKSISNFYKKSLVRIRYSAKFIALSSGLFGVVQNNFKNVLCLVLYTSSRNTNQILNIKLWIRLTEYPTQKQRCAKDYKVYVHW